jgi:hypothetical protein
VLIRTRKPWVRARRCRFGWNVRFMMSDPLSRSISAQRNLDNSEPRDDVSIDGGADSLRLSHDFVGVPLVCYSLVPCKTVGSPPEVFHNCGKKCGKATVFAPLTGPRCAGMGTWKRRKLKERRFSRGSCDFAGNRPVTTRFLRGESGRKWPQAGSSSAGAGG